MSRPHKGLAHGIVRLTHSKCKIRKLMDYIPFSKYKTHVNGKQIVCDVSDLKMQLTGWRASAIFNGDSLGL